MTPAAQARPHKQVSGAQYSNKDQIIYPQIGFAIDTIGLVSHLVTSQSGSIGSSFTLPGLSLSASSGTRAMLPSKRHVDAENDTSPSTPVSDR
jgi:hypothetical protein